jgi:alanine racemase
MFCEAKELRDAGLTAPVLILGESCPEEAADIVEASVTPAVATIQVAKALEDAARVAGRVVHVHLKIDSGMGRQGIRWDSVEPLACALAGMRHVRVAALFTHFAAAESDPDFTRWQYGNFLKAAQLVESILGPIPFKHSCNTAAAILYPEMRQSMVRLGVGWCGLNPGIPPEHLRHLKPALSLRAKVAIVKTLQPGDTAGYGRAWRATRPTRIALLPLGYCDGYPRVLSNNAEVLLRGRRLPVVGRISMDATLVDVTDAGNVQVGEEAVLIGRQGSEEITVEEIARRANTIVQDIVSTFSQRLPRVYVNGLTG